MSQACGQRMWLASCPALAWLNLEVAKLQSRPQTAINPEYFIYCPRERLLISLALIGNWKKTQGLVHHMLVTNSQPTTLLCRVFWAA